MRRIKINALFYLSYILADLKLMRLARACQKKAWRLALGDPAHSMDAYAKNVEKHLEEKKP